METFTVSDAETAMNEYARKRGESWWWIAKPEHGVLDRWETGAIGLLSGDLELRGGAWAVSAYDYARGFIGTRWRIPRP